MVKTSSQSLNLHLKNSMTNLLPLRLKGSVKAEAYRLGFKENADGNTLFSTPCSKNERSFI